MQDEEQETFETVNESPMQNIAVIESASSDTQTPVVSELPTVPDFPVLPSSEMMESDDPGIKEDVNKILSMLADMLAERRTLTSRAAQPGVEQPTMGQWRLFSVSWRNHSFLANSWAWSTCTLSQH